MKKVFFLLLVCFISFLVKGQNWNTIKVDRIDYFNYFNPIDTEVVFKMIKVDSVKIASNGDSVFYFQKTPRKDSIAYFYHFNCKTDSNVSWLGHSMYRNNITGVEIYKSNGNDTIKIFTKANLGDTLFIQKQGISNCFIAMVDSIEQETYNNTIDSIKYGRLFHYLNGAIINNPVLDTTPISITKFNGWKDAPQLYMHTPLNYYNLSFNSYKYGPIDIINSTYHLHKIPNEEVKKQFDRSMDLFEVVQVGNEWQTYTTNRGLFGNVYDTIINKDSIISIIWQNYDSAKFVINRISYKISHFTGYMSAPAYTTYSNSTSTDTLVYTRKTGYGFYPFHKIDTLYIPNPESYFIDSTSAGPYLFLDNWSLDTINVIDEFIIKYSTPNYIYYKDTNNCYTTLISLSSFQGVSGNYKHHHRLGVLEYKQEIIEVYTEKYTYDFKVLFMKTQNYNYGAKNTTLVISQYTKSPFTIYPNPALQNISFTNANQIQKVVIKNLNGAIVKSQDNGFGIDISGLPNQLYLIQVIDKDGRFFYDKLMKE